MKVCSCNDELCQKLYEHTLSKPGGGGGGGEGSHIKADVFLGGNQQNGIREKLQVGSKL